LVLVFTRGVKLSHYSIYPAVLLALSITVAINAYRNRHKKNYFLASQRERRYVNFIDRFYNETEIWYNQRYTYTSEYLQEFLWCMSVFVTPLPFYVPLILFPSEITNLIVMGIAMAFPMIIYTIYGLKTNELKILKEKRLKKQQYEKERQEQEKNEELGKWK